SPRRICARVGAAGSEGCCGTPWAWIAAATTSETRNPIMGARVAQPPSWYDARTPELRMTRHLAAYGLFAISALLPAARANAPALLQSPAARPAESSVRRPFGTLREQAALQQQWLRKRLDTFLPPLMCK